MQITFDPSLTRGAKLLCADTNGVQALLYAEGGGIELPDLTNSTERYVIGDITVLEKHSAAMMFRCFVKGEKEPRLFMRFGLLPGVKTRVCLDLNLLDMHTIYTNRTPGCLKLVVHGQRTKREDVTRFEIGIEKTFHDVTVLLENFYTLDTPPAEYPVPDEILVDEFGQWKKGEWPGKIHSLTELQNVLFPMEKEIPYPFPEWNRFGADNTRHLKEGTGFFSTFKSPDGRWHLTDPDGYDYFSLGPCGTNPGDFGRVDGFEACCERLPLLPNEQEFLLEDTRQRTPYMPPETIKMVNFAGMNLKRIYKDQWKEKWEDITCHILKGSGLNSQGNFPGLRINCSTDKDRIPYVRELRDFPLTETLIFRDFPDVFSPEYAKKADAYARQLSSWKDDPWLIGYFLRNEPEFNFIEDLIIANEVLRCPQKTCCRMALIDFLRDRYANDIASMNKVWGSDFTSFEELQHPIENCADTFPGSKSDLKEFSVILIREYIRIPAQACRQVDPNHLNLGLRWSKANNKDMMAGWEYFDVFSINCYDFDPTKDMDFVRDAGVDLPILIGEYHCGALDRGLSATGLKGVVSQKERGVMWRYFTEHVAAHPNGVAAHWFQYNDQFCLGRFDGENYQIGIVDVCMQPYPELQKASLETSRVLYKVKNGQQAPYARKPVAIPMIGY